MCCASFFELRERFKGPPNIERMLRFSHDGLTCEKRIVKELCVLRVREGGLKTASWAMDCNFKLSWAISTNLLIFWAIFAIFPIINWWWRSGGLFDLR